MVFIAGINQNKIARGGEEAKNQQIVNYFFRNNINVDIIDTHQWKKRFFSIGCQLIKYVLFAKNQQIYLSLSYQSTLSLLKIFKLFRVAAKNNIYFFVVGGVFHKWLENNQKQLALFKSLKAIYPESNQMVVGLRRLGLNNVTQISNIKFIPKLVINKDYSIIQFVFLSRISPTKGADLILKAVNKLNKNGFQKQFEVSFYGNFHDSIDSGYEKLFKTQISKIYNIKYKGFLQLQNLTNYDVLSQYNVMLFPTFWEGEGYAGVLIDAFIAALPVIATDWNHNKEIIHHNTNGILISPKSYESLAEAMKILIENKPLLKQLERGAVKSVDLYDIDKVFMNLFQPKTQIPIV
tara:strand:+ start:1473 stop:2522 length:1050 start_codon:yes stop_codon:yes gene_type:complete